MSKTEEQKAQEEFDAIARAESRRKVKGAKIAVGAVLGAAVVVLMGVYIGGGLSTSVPVEQGERDTLALTNDPQCREMISRVGGLQKDFQALELKLESDLLSKDEAKIKGVRSEIKLLRAKIEAEKKKSKDANLRYKASREELGKWFAYFDGELVTLDNVAKKELQRFEPKPEGDEKFKVELKKKKAKAPKKKSPDKMRDAAVLAVYDAFDKFKVWHTANLHPCGAASEGETPWAPPAKGAAGEKTSPKGANVQPDKVK